MILWRLTPARFADAALSGAGASLAGGRWNSRGRPAVYLSLAPATTVLETLTTFVSSNVPAEGYSLLEVDFDSDSVLQVPAGALPAGWNEPDDPGVAREFGDAFLRERRAALMVVPSAALPQALNAVLNPLHPQAAQARIVARHSFTFDPRWPLQ